LRGGRQCTEQAVEIELWALRQAQGAQRGETLEEVCRYLTDADSANVQGGDVIEARRQ
jgi:hypothetical protein